MSWFSRSFSMKEDEDEDERTSGEEDEDEEESHSLNLADIASATGASVKEDFSNLTKTFTRQLWGVASFLAPPPPEKSSLAETGGEEEEESLQKEQLVVPQHQQHQQGKDGEVRDSSGAAALEMESQIGRADGFGLQNPGGIMQSITLAGRGTTSGGAFLAPEEIDPQLTVSRGNADNNNSFSPGEINTLPGSNEGFERPKLTGLRSDFAELRGTVATGISRITSVLREVARDDDSGGEDEDEEEEHLPLVSKRESPHHPLSNAVVGEQQQGLNSPRRGFDAFLKPLFGNMLMREKTSSIEGDAYPAEEEGAEKGTYYARESPKGKGENYRELESLPSAIASGIGGISKFASSLLQIVNDELDEDKEDELEDQDLAVGLPEPVVTFARNIATHPETWLDFPLTEDDADDDFELTNAQKEHIRALEVAVPGLEALKIELCPNYMTEGRFWKIYFVLIYPRLSSNAALILSSQQVVRARTSMLQELQRREVHADELDHRQEDLIDEKVESVAVETSRQDSQQEEDEFGSRLSTPPTNNTSVSNPTVSSSFEDTRRAGEVGRVDHSISGSQEKEATDLIQSEQEKGRFSMLHVEDETEADEWPDEEPSTKQNEVGDPDSRLDTSNLEGEDVSFSDLEEDDSSDKATFTNEGMSSSSPKTLGSIVLDNATAGPLVPSETSSPMTQGDGTPRKSSESREFNDWFKVDQDDVASAGSSSP